LSTTASRKNNVTTDHSLKQTTKESASLAGRLETCDIDEHSEASALQAKFSQLSPGTLKVVTEFAQIPGLMVYRQHINRRINIHGDGPDGWIMLGTVATPRCRITLNSGSADAQHLVMLPPSRELELSIYENSNPVVLMVDPDLLKQYLDEESCAALLCRPPSFQSDPDFNNWLIGSCNQLIDKYLGNDGLLNNEDERAAIQHSLLEGLARRFAGGQHELGRDTRAKRNKSLRRALEYAQSSNQSLSMAKLADVTGVSQRTLDYAFKDHFALPPLKIVKILRMNNLHRRLLHAEPSATTVTKEAVACGFSELGRMAIEYRKLFAEKPSETLHKVPRQPSIRLTNLLRSAADQ
jgi:AraC family ethanolamine operon transcriptional activator